MITGRVARTDLAEGVVEEVLKEKIDRILKAEPKIEAVIFKISVVEVHQKQTRNMWEKGTWCSSPMRGKRRSIEESIYEQALFKMYLPDQEKKMDHQHYWGLDWQRSIAKSFVGYVQVLSDKKATTLKITAMFVYLLEWEDGEYNCEWWARKYWEQSNNILIYSCDHEVYDKSEALLAKANRSAIYWSTGNDCGQTGEIWNQLSNSAMRRMEKRIIHKHLLIY